MSLIFTSTKHLNLQSFSPDIAETLTIIPNDVFKCSYELHGNTQYLNIESETFKAIVLFYDGDFDHWYIESKKIDDRCMIKQSKEKSLINLKELFNTYQKHVNYINGFLKK